MGVHKRQTGCYYTIGDPFALTPFKNWARKINLKNKVVLEPFAGANNIINLLEKNNFISEFYSFDIQPADKSVEKRDTLKNFPTDFEVAITNPPWLAKNSAKRRGLKFPKTQYDDSYKHCLDLCLQNCKYVGALIPATFLQSGLFRDRLDTFIVLHDRGMFFDTDNPVALALFSQRPRSAKIYYDNRFIGDLEGLEERLPQTESDLAVKFNKPNGQLGFIAFDNTREPTIRFCRGDALNKHEIKHTTRMITRIDLDIEERMLDNLISKLNRQINRFREETYDVFLTPFKGLRRDGMYRRRMEYSLAKEFILEHA